MASVIRVKRRLDEEPLDSLLISCKKQKPSDDSSKEMSAVLKFAGTIQNQDEDILKHIKSVPTKSDIEENYKKHVVNVSDKLRKQKLQDIKENRFKVVNRFRSSVDESKKKEMQCDEYTVYDVEYDENQNTHMVPDKTLEQAKYVYDLYYTTSDDLSDMYLEDYVSVCPLSDELIYGSIRDNGIWGHDSDDDSEDSNAENNWRNDYPDESDMDSVTEDDMIGAVENMNLSDNLSTDEGEEDLVYTDDCDGAYYNYLDDSDEVRFGKKYAQFKAKYNKMQISECLEIDLYHGDIDPDDSD